MKSKFAAKQRARRSVILLLALALCMQLGGIPAAAADGVASANGTVEVWRWVRVDSQDDLPRRDKAGYRHPVLLLYEWNKGYYMVDANRRTSGSPFELLRTDLPDGVAYGEKTFRTAENISHMTLLYQDEDDDNGDARQYKLITEKKDDSGFLYALHCTDTFFANGFEEKSGAGDSGVISVLTPGVVSSAGVASGRVALFSNISGADSKIRIDKDSGNVYSTRSALWDMAQFAMYVGYKEEFSAIQSDCTIGSGQVANYNGYVYIAPGVTITVEKGGVLSVSGVLYNNGTIVNNGGDIVVQKNATIEQFCLDDSSGGVICCDGGDLVILSGGCVTVGKSETYSSYQTGLGNGFVLRNGATCTNFGTLVVGCNAYVVSGATLDNRASGSMFFEYKPRNAYVGNLYGLTATAAAAADKYESLVDYNTASLTALTMLYVGDDVLLQNDGTVYLGLWARNTTGSAGTEESGGSGKICVPSGALNLVTKYNWNSAFPSGWRSMLVES